MAELAIIMSVTCPPGRLKNSREFRRVYERGQRQHSPFFTAFFLYTTSKESRVGFTVTRKIGNAVVRNRCKRRLREVVRRCYRRLVADLKCESSGTTIRSFDLVLNVRSALIDADFRQLEASFERLLRSIALAGSPDSTKSGGTARSHR